MSAIYRAALQEAAAELLAKSIRIRRDTPAATEAARAYATASSVVTDLANWGAIPEDAQPLSLFAAPDPLGTMDMFGDAL